MKVTEDRTPASAWRSARLALRRASSGHQRLGEHCTLTANRSPRSVGSGQHCTFTDSVRKYADELHPFGFRVHLCNRISPSTGASPATAASLRLGSASSQHRERTGGRRWPTRPAPSVPCPTGAVHPVAPLPSRSLVAAPMMPMSALRGSLLRGARRPPARFRGRRRGADSGAPDSVVAAPAPTVFAPVRLGSSTAPQPPTAATSWTTSRGHHRLGAGHACSHHGARPPAPRCLPSGWILGPLSPPPRGRSVRRAAVSSWTRRSPGGLPSPGVLGDPSLARPPAGHPSRGGGLGPAWPPRRASASRSPHPRSSERSLDGSCWRRSCHVFGASRKFRPPSTPP
jgi:hypothetical protein